MEKFELIGELLATSASGYIATVSGIDTGKSNAMTTAKNTDTDKSFGNVAPWGDSNSFPTDWEKSISDSTEMTTSAITLQSLLYSNGIEYVIEDIIDGKKVVRYEKNEILENLINCYFTEAYLQSAAYELARHDYLFPEINFNHDKSKVDFLAIQKCVEMRFGLMDSKGFISKAFLNSKWEDGIKDDDKGTTEIKVLSPLIDTDIELIKKEKNIKNYIFRLPVLSRYKYYPEHSGYSAVRQKWVSYANKLAIYKDKIMDRQTSWKYHLEINQEWLKLKYEDDWKNATVEQKQDIFKKELQHFNDVNKGVEKSGGNFASSFIYDSNGNKQSSWIVNDLKGQTFSGEYNEDGRMASERIFWAWGVSPSMIGSIQPSGHTAGSGSDIKASFNTSNINIIRKQEFMLMPLRWAAAYNGADLSKFKIRFKKTMLVDDNQMTEKDRQANNQKQ